MNRLEYAVEGITDRFDALELNLIRDVVRDARDRSSLLALLRVQREEAPDAWQPTIQNIIDKMEEHTNAQVAKLIEALR